VGIFNWYYLSSPPQIPRFSRFPLETGRLMWLVGAVRKRGCVGPAVRFEQRGKECCFDKAERALEVIRSFPSSSRSTNACCGDVQKRRFFVSSAMLLRHPDLAPWMEEKQNNSGGRNRSRAAVGPVGAIAAGQARGNSQRFIMSYPRKSGGRWRCGVASARSCTV
jgi:hypothetical protein